MHQHWQITETLSQQRLKCESCAQWVGIRSWHGKPSPKKAPARSWSWRRQEHVAQQPPIFCRKIQRSWGSPWRGLSDMWSKYQISINGKHFGFISFIIIFWHNLASPTSTTLEAIFGGSHQTSSRTQKHRSTHYLVQGAIENGRFANPDVSMVRT